MKRKINAIVIHCSATPNGKDIRAADIDKMHQQRGWQRTNSLARDFNPKLTSIGYHFVICVDGTIQTGRHIEEIGAHVQGNNTNSVGVCMIGLDKFTLSQWESLRNCLLGLVAAISSQQVYNVTHCQTLLKDMGINVLGHRDYSPDLNGDGIITRNEWIKDCPNFEVKDWMKNGMLPVEAATLKGKIV